MNRREFLAGVGGALAMSGCATTATLTSPEAARRPNVLLIMSDDQGYGDLGCHGNPILRTPNLDRLHAESTRLTRFYVCPVCSPTRASLMTGRYHYRTGVVDTFQGRSMMHADERTLPESLRDAGYHTGIFGKWHLGDHYPLRAIDQGFNEALLHRGGGLMQPSSPPGDHYFDPYLEHNGVVSQHQGYCTDIFTDAAIRYIETHQHGQFFAYLATNAPHTPLEVDQRYVAPYLAQGIEEPVAKVYGMITNLDENVGRVLDTLERLQLANNTIVIFMTDNGAQSRHAQRHTAGQRGNKGTVYEGGIHVPCFVRWPGHLQSGRDLDHLSAHIDLLPTILAACEAPLPDAELDGENLLHVLQGQAPVEDGRSIFLQWHRGDRPEPIKNAAVVTQQYKLVEGKELYDLQGDPGEERDLAAEQPGVVAKLRADYDSWFADVSSTRDFEPPAIHVGTPYENPTVLTAQDWRGSEQSRNSGKALWKLSWEEGNYEIAFDLSAPLPAGVQLKVSIGGKNTPADIDNKSETRAVVRARIPHGRADLAFTLVPNVEEMGVAYATINRH